MRIKKDLYDKLSKEELILMINDKVVQSINKRLQNVAGDDKYYSGWSLSKVSGALGNICDELTIKIDY